MVGIPSKPLSWMAGELIRSGVRIVPSRVASRAELRELVRLAVRRIDSFGSEDHFRWKKSTRS